MSLNFVEHGPHDSDLLIRLVTTDHPAAARAIGRLAQLDSAPLPPAGPVLLAERRGRAIAAHVMADDTAIADPFEPTAEAVKVLALRADQLRASACRRSGHSVRAALRGTLDAWRLRGAAR
jgi:hypothetical protein